MLVTERTTLAAELQAAMATRGATEWSKVLDVDRTTVHKWWAGDAYPRGKQLEAIARETQRQIRFMPDEKEAALPDWGERLDRLERWMRAIAAAAGVPSEVVDEIEAARRDVPELGLGEKPPGTSRQTEGSRPLDE